MIHRKPVPLYIPSPNSPVPPMTFSPVHQEPEEHVRTHEEDYPPPLPEGWDMIIQDAKEASLDTVHIKRRLTRPPGIAPTPSLVHSRQSVSNSVPNLAFAPPLPRTRTPSRSRKPHEQYRPPTPPRASPRHAYEDRRRVSTDVHINPDTDTAYPTHTRTRGTSLNSSNSTLNAIPPIGRYDIDASPRYIVHEVQFDGLGNAPLKLSKSDTKHPHQPRHLHPGQHGGGGLWQRIELRLRRLGTVVSTLSAKR
ncbi:hypothetical protein ONZ45_g17251 [Pleurotus djamor]|nr:hypothetical protein ONZ45_g17251 [Pleurotus djamor]